MSEVINLEYIKERRAKLEISQQKMAEILGFKNSSTYCKYENGETKMKAEMLPVIAKALDCNIENFFVD